MARVRVWNEKYEIFPELPPPLDCDEMWAKFSENLNEDDSRFFCDEILEENDDEKPILIDWSRWIPPCECNLDCVIAERGHSHKYTFWSCARKNARNGCRFFLREDQINRYSLCKCNRPTRNFRAKGHPVMFETCIHANNFTKVLKCDHFKSWVDENEVNSFN